MDSEWVIVKSKNKPEIFKKTSTINLNRENIVDILKLAINESYIKNNIETIILHGSVGLDKFNDYSDIDLAIIWKKKINNYILTSVINNIKREINRKIDIANFVYAIGKTYKNIINKHPNGDTEQINCFKDLIVEKGVSIFGNINDINYSVYISNIKS